MTEVDTESSRKYVDTDTKRRDDTYAMHIDTDINKYVGKGTLYISILSIT